MTHLDKLCGARSTTMNRSPMGWCPKPIGVRGQTHLNAPEAPLCVNFGSGMALIPGKTGLLPTLYLIKFPNCDKPHKIQLNRTLGSVRL